MKYKYIIIIFLLLAESGFGQPINDECETAIVLDDVTDWCSDNGEYSNIDATTTIGGYGAADCWDTNDNDVWFRFTATGTAVDIVVHGLGNGGTLKNPLVALYIDNGCYDTLVEKKCKKDFSGTNVVELNEGAMIIGESYLLRIDGEFGNTGTFQLCIKNYFPPIEPGQDCATASLLCDKSPFVVEHVIGAGDDPHETDGTCISEEKQMTWFKWIAKNSGTLTFVLNPLQSIDDLDFVLFELPGGINDCDNKIVLRCDATFGGNHVPCGPKTGLSLYSTDLEEDYNCDAGEDGFVKYIDMSPGKAYALAINNWSSSSIGFSIEFGGTGEFAGPTPDFIFDPPTGLRCEDSISIIDNTSYDLGSIVERYWTFGRDASPQIGSNDISTNVFYDSYGWKSITLTVKSDKGCVSTVVKDIWMEPCCEDLPIDERLKIVVDEVKNPNCAGYEDGSIKISGIRGAPYYRYSIQDNNFKYNNYFQNLGMGTYKVYIVDKKGCRDSVLVDIVDPEALIADAGSDQNIELTDITSLNGSYSPPNYSVTQEWTPPYNLADSSDFGTKAWPYKTTTYTLKVVQDETGCTAQDEMTIFVKDVREVWIPNIFTPNDDGYNDFFTAYDVKAATRIVEMNIYDRWGELIYQDKDIPIGDTSQGWDGTFKGEKVNSGVYVYLFKIRFLDNQVLPFSGDITVLR